MDSRSFPHVSVVTPVYNGAEHLAECIESVLAQTYTNWDYTVVDNCSTDGSGKIARRYAAKDLRVRVIENSQFLRAVANHNAALRQISPGSKYCKIVFADDWIFPRCLEEMVVVAEENPSVGIVGAYGLQEHEVMWTGLPYSSRVVSGREVCRRLFLEGTYVFGTSNSLLYRSDLVRRGDPFYNESNLHADMEACVVLLKSCDFGFVHQILTFKRLRPESLGSFTEDMQTLLAGHLQSLVAHGRNFLTQEEFDFCVRRLVKDYYNFLAVSLMRGRRDKKFWDYHSRKLREAAVGFSRARLAEATLVRLAKALVNPNETAEKLLRRRTVQKPMSTSAPVRVSASRTSASAASQERMERPCERPWLHNSRYGAWYQGTTSVVPERKANGSLVGILRGCSLPTATVRYHKRNFWSEENLKYLQPHFRLTKAARMVNRLAQRRECDLLDVGCGPAALAQLLDINIRYHGIDIAIHNPGPHLIERDFVENPIEFGGKKFDIIVAQGVFEYIGTVQAEKFREIAELLNEGGKFLVSYVNFNHRNKNVYWPYNNIQSLGDFQCSLERFFKIERFSPTSQRWRHDEPRTRLKRAVQIHINFNIPFLSRKFAVEYFFICSARKTG